MRRGHHKKGQASDMEILAFPVLMTHHCSSSFFLSHLLHPFFLLFPFILSLFSLYLSNFSFFFLFLFPFLSLHTFILSFLHLSSLSLAKHPSHNHAVPGFLLGFGKHRDKFVAETFVLDFQVGTSTNLSLKYKTLKGLLWVIPRGFHMLQVFNFKFLSCNIKTAF